MDQRHAIVIGASVGGLLAARALSDAFDRVTVLDRDALPVAVGHRRGVPHGRHAHGLLAGGRQALEELFPGFTRDLVAQGALPRDLQDEFRWCNDGHDLRRAPSGLQGLLLSRALLEGYVRARVAALDGVAILDRRSVLGLVATGGRVRGVRVHRADDVTEVLTADLVVDASGRGSRSPRWLEDLGYPAPPRETVTVDIAYATRTYRREADHLDGGGGIAVSASQAAPRGAALLAQEGDRWILTLYGMSGDTPPTDPDGFLAFAARLPSPAVHDFIRDAEPLDDPVHYRYPASTRRRYESLDRFPEGYLVFGDAICSFNPVYGQGMTVAAREAVALRAALRTGTQRLAPRFFEQAAKVVDGPWDIAVGADLRFPTVTGPRTPKVRLVNAYLARVHLAAATDPAVGRAFLRVANLLARPERLLAPDVALRVLRGVVRARRRPGRPRPVHGPAVAQPAYGSAVDVAAAAAAGEAV